MFVSPSNTWEVFSDPHIALTKALASVSHGKYV